TYRAVAPKCDARRQSVGKLLDAVDRGRERDEQGENAHETVAVAALDYGHHDQVATVQVELIDSEVLAERLLQPPPLPHDVAVTLDAHLGQVRFARGPTGAHHRVRQ